MIPSYSIHCRKEKTFDEKGCLKPLLYCTVLYCNNTIWWYMWRYEYSYDGIAQLRECVMTELVSVVSGARDVLSTGTRGFKSINSFLDVKKVIFFLFLVPRANFLFSTRCRLDYLKRAATSDDILHVLSLSRSPQKKARVQSCTVQYSCGRLSLPPNPHILSSPDWYWYELFSSRHDAKNKAQKKTKKISFEHPVPCARTTAAGSLGILLILLVQRLLILLLVLPQLRSLGVERASVVGLSEKTLDGQQYGSHVVHRGPLLLEDVQADVAKLIDVWVKARRFKLHRRSLERVIIRKRQAQLVRQTLVHLWMNGERAKTKKRRKKKVSL